MPISKKKKNDDAEQEKGRGMPIGLAFFKFKSQLRASALQRQKQRRQEQFGIEYLKLATQKHDKKEAKDIFKKAVKDIQEVNQELKRNEEKLERRTQHDRNDPSKDAPLPSRRRKKKKEESNIIIPEETEQYPEPILEKSIGDRGVPGKTGRGAPSRGGHDGIGRNGRDRGVTGKTGRGAPSRGHDGTGRNGRGTPGRGSRGAPGRGGRGGTGRSRGGRGSQPGRSRQLPTKEKSKPASKQRLNQRHPVSPSKLPKRVQHRENFQLRHSPEGKRARLSAVNLALAPPQFKSGSNVEKWTHSQFQLKEYHTNGAWSKTTEGIVEKHAQKSIQRGIAKFKKHPQLFIAMMYPTEMLKWPEVEQEYTLIYRDGTTGLQPKGVNPRGQVTFLIQEYQPLPSFPKDILPKKYCDKYTDSMTYRGNKLVTKQLPAYLPGRGTGLLDDPCLKLIGDIDPSDIAQGQVGDCWLLSGIASLAEFDGAIQRLFRNTKDLEMLPYADGRTNMYTVTLWDLKTWEEVDIEVDERLPARKDMPGALFGAKHTLDGELWLCYLEKAIAAHCGGWDKIDGGQCTHAWSLLTGCKEQYVIQRVPEDLDHGPFGIWAKYNPESKRWAEHGNSPHEGHLGVWRTPWPEVGLGGDTRMEDLSKDDLFEYMCLWSENNFLMGASSKGESDRHETNGVVDNHAYSVIDCQANVANTGIDMIQVRNPWGYGCIENGRFGRKGEGWRKYPEIQQALQYKELEEDDGVFWATKDEFFKHFQAIYLGTINMKKFLGIPEDVETSQSIGIGGLPMAPNILADSDGEKENETVAKHSAPAGIPETSRVEKPNVADLALDLDQENNDSGRHSLHNQSDDSRNAQGRNDMGSLNDNVVLMKTARGIGSSPEKEEKSASFIDTGMNNQSQAESRQGYNDAKSLFSSADEGQDDKNDSDASSPSSSSSTYQDEEAEGSDSSTSASDGDAVSIGRSDYEKEETPAPGISVGIKEESKADSVVPDDAKSSHQVEKEEDARQNSKASSSPSSAERKDQDDSGGSSVSSNGEENDDNSSSSTSVSDGDAISLGSSDSGKEEKASPSLGNGIIKESPVDSDVSEDSDSVNQVEEEKEGHQDVKASSSYEHGGDRDNSDASSSPSSSNGEEEEEEYEEDSDSSSSTSASDGDDISIISSDMKEEK